MGETWGTPIVHPNSSLQPYRIRLCGGLGGTAEDADVVGSGGIEIGLIALWTGEAVEIDIIHGINKTNNIGLTCSFNRQLLLLRETEGIPVGEVSGGKGLRPGNGREELRL